MRRLFNDHFDARHRCTRLLCGAKLIDRDPNAFYVLTLQRLFPSPPNRIEIGVCRSGTRYKIKMPLGRYIESEYTQ